MAVNLLCKIQLNFTPVVDNSLCSTYRYPHFATQVSIFNKIWLRDLEAVLQCDGAAKKGTLNEDVLYSNEMPNFVENYWEMKIINIKEKKKHRKDFSNNISFQLQLLTDI